MNSKEQLRSPLNIKLIGPAVEKHRISVDQLALFAGQIQSAVQRIGRILSGHQTSLQPGRAPKELADSCSLDIVALNPGSLEICFDLHQPPMLPIDTLGTQAIDNLVKGVKQLAGDDLNANYPVGFDKGVLLALRESGKLLSQGIQEIQYLRGTSGLSAVYTMSVHEKVIKQIQGPVVNKCTIEGTLLMGDFKAGRLACRIHPRVGAAIRCTFNDEQKDAILAAMTCFVKAFGEATSVQNEIKEFKIADIEIVEFKSEMSSVLDSNDFFERKIDIDQLAEEQGVRACSSFENLLGNFWPEEETADDFLASVALISNKYGVG